MLHQQVGRRLEATFAPRLREVVTDFPISDIFDPRSYRVPRVGDDDHGLRSQCAGTLAIRVIAPGASSSSITSASAWPTTSSSRASARKSFTFEEIVDGIEVFSPTWPTASAPVLGRRSTRRR